MYLGEWNFARSAHTHILQLTSFNEEKRFIFLLTWCWLLLLSLSLSHSLSLSFATNSFLFHCVCFFFPFALCLQVFDYLIFKFIRFQFRNIWTIATKCAITNVLIRQYEIQFVQNWKCASYTLLLLLVFLFFFHFLQVHCLINRNLLKPQNNDK